MRTIMKIKLNFFLAVLLISSVYGQQKPRIYINEFLASNVSVNADIVDFDDYSDWIELYNDEETSINIGGWFISDDKDEPARYRFPADVIIPSKGHLLLWADGHNDVPGKVYRRDYYPYDYYTTKYFHLSFSLSRAGESISLYDSDTTLIDVVEYDLQQRDISMGRKPDGGNEWQYFGDPTPGTTNSTLGMTSTSFSADPVVNVKSGFYSSAQQITISSAASNYLIRYTLDGSRPSENSSLFTQPIQINSTSVLRVRVYEQDKLPGSIHTYSYFINEPTNLSVLSIAASPGTLFDNEKGIYKNQFKSREIPAVVEFFEPDRVNGFEIEAGLRMTGQASLDYPQKSFTLTTDSKYGKDIIDYQVFPDRKLNNFTELYLRNAGVPDNRLTMFRDGLLQTLVFNKIDIDCQAYKPAVLFINGEYYGIYNIREKIGSAYLASINNINPDDIDLLEYNQNKTPETVEGSSEEFLKLISFFEQNDLTLQENYEYVKSQIDINEYINYYITEIYYDNIFWLNQNVRVWKERKDGRKWRWILYDTDNAFGAKGPGTSRYQTNTLQLAASPVETGVYPLWSTLTFRKLLANEEFRNRFIQKFSGYLNTIFHPDSVLTLITEFQWRISSEMFRHIPRWNTGGMINGLLPIASHIEWQNNIRDMRLFAANRPAFQRQHILTTFNLSGTAEVTFDISGSGRIMVNDAESISVKRKGIYFREIPLELKAVPDIGYRFVKWSGISDSLNQNVSIVVISDSLSITAVFEEISVNKLPAVISQNTTLTGTGSPYYAPGTVKVAPNTTLFIEPGVNIMMPFQSNLVINGKLVIDGTKDDPVTIMNNETSESWGALCFIDATDSSVIKNLIIKGATTGVDFTRDRAALSSYNSNLSLDGVIVEDVQAPIFIQLGKIEIKNCRLRTNFSGDLINIKRAEYALTENCDLMGNDAFDSDAIDYDQIKSGIIRNNRIYNIYGFNSDAIDLGEDSKNILIENNIIYNVADKGISIGNQSSGIIKRNVIANCDQGVGIKDYISYGYIEHNTFYGNNYAVACFEKNIGEGGGTADVINSILINSRTSSVLKDNLSTLNISYSLSNTDSLDGHHNIKASPLLLNDLYPRLSSPVINKGNPGMPYDPDGTIADIGAYPFDQYRQTNLIINEIHHSPANGDEYQFIEIANAGESSVNLEGFKLVGDIQCTFTNEIIAAGEYIIAAKNKSVYEGKGFKVFQWEQGDLRSTEGEVILYNNQSRMMDFVNYDSRYWWPDEPASEGHSLELHNTSLENMISYSWRSSKNVNGTPGKSNDSKLVTGIFINEILASNDNLNADEKGEFDDWIEIYNSNEYEVNIAGLYVTDKFDNPCKYQIPFHSEQQTAIPAKGHLLLWADEQTEQGLLHLNFKLEKNGETIGLIQVTDGDTLFIDSVSFSAQTTNISYGRESDGYEKWIYFNTPTPQDTNKIISGLPDEEPVPVYALSQNYPNPFNPATVIKWELAKAGDVTLKVYDILGREVITLVDEFKPAGKYESRFRAEALSSGIYIYQLRSGDYVQTRKMMLLR